MLRRFLIGSIAAMSVLGVIFAFSEIRGPAPPKVATASGMAGAAGPDRAAPLGGRPDPGSRTSVAKAKPAGTTPADFTRHVMRLKERLPSDEFTVVVEPPFVVIGDEEPRQVNDRAKGTVKWAVDQLKASFFEKEPAEILEVWLFKDKASYEKHAAEVFGSSPSTPYGYYSSQHKALVMNIATGGGTLVHEIVHPFVAADFPRCPAWLNEGLGSLFEQCGMVEGRIQGFTNWRLAGLQEAIEGRGLPTFETLCSTSSEEFYDDPNGTNYAQARYLCYYLQQRNLLRRFYREFRAGCDDDPCGYATLLRVLGAKDSAKFQEEWERFVLGLRFSQP